MSKPIQLTDLSNMVPKVAHKAAGAVSGEGETVSFSKVLSENEAVPAEHDSLQTAPEGGKKLPPGDKPDTGQTQGKPDIAAREAINIQADTIGGATLPVEAPEEVDGQKVLMQLAEADRDLPVQVDSPVEPLTTQHAVLQAVNLPAVEGQSQPASQPPAAGPQQPAQVSETLHVLQPGSAEVVPGNQPLLPVAGQTAPVLLDPGVSAVRLPPAEIQMEAPVAESAAGVVRVAAQLAVASQGTNDALKQYLSEGRNFQPEMKVLAAPNQTDMSSGVFAQTLTDNTVALPAAKVEIPVGQSGWGRAVGQQVVWFVSQNISAANLRLNPQQLGPLEMHVSMEGDKTSVAFVSQHAVVREALEAALPRLREMFADNGLNLANVNVSQQGNSDRGGQASAGSAQAGDAENSAAGGADMEIALGDSRAVKTMLGLVDYYV